MADQPQELDGERRLVIQDGNEVAVVEGEQPALRGGSCNCCPRAAVEESDFAEDLVCADEPQHDFPSALRGHADPYDARNHGEEPEPRVALSEYRGSYRIADQAGVRGELTHDLAGHATEELVPRQEGALVGHQVVEVHRTLNVKWASILPGRRFRLNGAPNRVFLQPSTAKRPIFALS